MRKGLRSPKDRVKVWGWVALLVLLVATGLSLPSVLSSRLVSQKRAAFALKRARAHLASHQIDQARAEFRAALQLDPGQAMARRELADMELGVGQTDSAFLAYESLTEMHPEDVDGWLKLAGLMVKRGQLEAPEALLDRAIELDPHRGDLRLMRGNIRLRLGRYYGAFQDAQAAVSATPDDADGWVLFVRAAARSQGAASGLALVTRAIGRLGELPALVSLRAGLLPGAKAPDLGPPPAPPRRLRADAQTGRGNLGAWTREHWPGHLAEIRESFEAATERRDWPEAQRLVDSAASASPGSPFAPFLGGMLALASGDVKLAEQRLLQALAIAPRLPATVAALGRTWSLQRGPSFAAAQLLRIGTVDPEFALARYMAARAYIEAHDPPRAEAALRSGLQLQPESPVPYQQLTDYYFGLDRAAEAFDISRQGVERFPEDTGLQMMLAQIEEGTGQPRAAIATYDELLAKKPDVDFAQYKLAMVLASEPGDAAHQRLLAVLEKLRGDTPSDPSLLNALGWLSFKANDTRRARELLETAVSGAPEEPSFHYHLAVLYTQENDKARAREELQTALAVPHPFPERVDAARLLRQNDTPPASTDKASVTSGRR